MAEGVVFDVVGRLLKLSGSLGLKEIILGCGVKDEIRKLKDTVETIQAVLLDAEKKHTKKNHQVTLWLRRLKDAVYDADDLLDDFATELEQREVMSGNRMTKEVRIFFSKSNQLVYSVKMGHKIKTIREKLDAIKSDRQFHLEEKPVENIAREETHSYVRTEDVIGRENDKNEIIQLLFNSNDGENISVIPIVGIGGLGKTTLAQLVYYDEMVKNHFELRMWVSVPDDFDVRIIVQNIIKSVNEDGDVEGLEKLNLDELQKRLHREINKKRYLLVLDNIWNENRENWLKLKILLMNDIRGSKILITTRSLQVAKITSELAPYILRGLTEDMSWHLFTQMAFRKGIEPKGSNLVQIGKCTVEKCVGVPLAIRTIGCLLYYNDNENYWLHFMNDELSKISQEESDIIPKLKLSYDHLPSYLKQCFAYCALFPKNYIIKKDYLVDLWMAQGFLQSSNMNQSLEVIGNEYLMNFLSRSFFKDAEYDKSGNVTICKMHDLATLDAGRECTKVKMDVTNNLPRARHISFDSLDFSRKIPAAFPEINHIRTFLLPIYYKYASIMLSKINVNKILSSFKWLHTLDLIGLNIKKLPNSISELKHLRYLDLSYNKYIKKLPNSMSRLHNLQTLKLNCCSSLEELPKNIKKMVNLRCLMLENCWCLIRFPRGLRHLTNLRRLSMFVLGKKSGKSAELWELNEMNNLSGALKIRGLKNVGSKPTLANLKSEEHLKCLELEWSSTSYVEVDGLADDLATISPDELDDTIRTLSELDWDSTSSDDPLYNDVGINEAVLECLQPHQNLEVLHIDGFNGLMISSWLSSLTNLSSIVISNCKKCQHIPSLHHLPSLESFESYFLRCFRVHM